MRPRHIGLTGNIGSGKSTVAELLTAKGAALIDADALARAATEDPAVLQAVADALGPDLVQDGRLDRARTAERVFGDEAARRALNAIIHPWVRRRSAERAETLATSETPPEVILFDIPLLYEGGLETSLDAVIVVNAPLALRIRRVQARSGLSEADIRARDAAQLPLEDKVARANFVLENSGDLEALRAEVEALWPRLVGHP